MKKIFDKVRQWTGKQIPDKDIEMVLEELANRDVYYPSDFTINLTKEQKENEQKANQELNEKTKSLFFEIDHDNWAGSDMEGENIATIIFGLVLSANGDTLKKEVKNKVKVQYDYKGGKADVEFVKGVEYPISLKRMQDIKDYLDTKVTHPFPEVMFEDIRHTKKFTDVPWGVLTHIVSYYHAHNGEVSAKDMLGYVKYKMLKQVPLNKLGANIKGSSVHPSLVGQYYITDAKEDFYVGTYGDLGKTLTWVETRERANLYGTYEKAQEVVNSGIPSGEKIIKEVTKEESYKNGANISGSANESVKEELMDKLFIMSDYAEVHRSEGDASVENVYYTALQGTAKYAKVDLGFNVENDNYSILSKRILNSTKISYIELLKFVDKQFVLIDKKIDKIIEEQGKANKEFASFVDYFENGQENQNKSAISKFERVMKKYLGSYDYWDYVSTGGGGYTGDNLINALKEKGADISTVVADLKKVGAKQYYYEKAKDGANVGFGNWQKVYDRVREWAGEEITNDEIKGVIITLSDYGIHFPVDYVADYNEALQRDGELEYEAHQEAIHEKTEELSGKLTADKSVPLQQKYRDIIWALVMMADGDDLTHLIELEMKNGGNLEDKTEVSVTEFNKYFMRNYGFISHSLTNKQVQKFLDRSYIKEVSLPKKADLFQDYLLANGLADDVQLEKGAKIPQFEKLPKNRQANKKYKYFAVGKSDGKIVDGWEIVSDVESLKYYAKLDLKDNDYNPKDFNIVSKESIMKKGINPFDFNNWRKIDYSNDVPYVPKAKSGANVEPVKIKAGDRVLHNADHSTGTVQFIDEDGHIIWRKDEDGFDEKSMPKYLTKMHKAKNGANIKELSEHQKATGFDDAEQHSAYVEHLRDQYIDDSQALTNYLNQSDKNLLTKHSKALFKQVNKAKSEYLKEKGLHKRYWGEKAKNGANIKKVYPKIELSKFNMKELYALYGAAEKNWKNDDGAEYKRIQAEIEKRTGNVYSDYFQAKVETKENQSFDYGIGGL
jgi:hypothetical protein